MRFFNPRTGERVGAAETAEGWQILSPVRSAAHGVPYLNRLVHKQFRHATIHAARKDGRQRKIAKPVGAEEIVYGDKALGVDRSQRSAPGRSPIRLSPMVPGAAGVSCSGCYLVANTLSLSIKYRALGQCGCRAALVISNW